MHLSDLKFDARCDFAASSVLSEAAQEVLVNDPAGFVRSALARNPFTLERHLWWLLEDQMTEVLEALAENPSLSRDLQAKLAEEEVDVLWYLAKNTNLHPDIQKGLVECDDVEVRSELAANEAITEEVVRLLAVDASAEVRSAVAEERANLLLDVQELLASDESWEVRRYLAFNENLDSSVYARLSFDAHHMVLVALENTAGVVWDETFKAYYLAVFAPEKYMELIAGYEEAASALIEKWPGSLQDLIEVCQLIER